ncbi:MAG: hypothetical protein EX260_02985 [Desulfobulbaceae bacterium]|nr:MAG: hypothetical protein EX260_02985 [Desulfobulbaceae bacterium]
METIHLKTPDPVSQHLLRSAAQQGIDLPWERYEKAQPQDGFMRLGLYCPLECLHGPCRIDPFSRGPTQGICGLGREQMVAATLLRLCQKGATQALAGAPHCNDANGLELSGALGNLIDKTLTATRQDDLSCSEIFEAAGLLQRSFCSQEKFLQKALRLGLLTLALVDQSSISAKVDTLECSTGYGVIPEAPVRVGFSGRPPQGLIDALEKGLLNGPAPSAALLSLGDWLRLDGRYMPIGVTSGEAELLLSSGAIHLLVAGPGTDPGVIALCKQMNVPVVTDYQTADPGDILKQARTRAAQSSYPDLFADVPAGLLTRVIMSPDSFSKTIVNDSVDQVALIGGADTPHLPLGSLAGDLFTALTGTNVKIAGWGDTALWMARRAQVDASVDQPLILENNQGPLLAIKGLAEAEKLHCLKGVCFAGMRDVLDLNIALGLACIGFRVSIATPIPLHGSNVVNQTLSQLIMENGGELLHFDHPAEAGDLVNWFTAL